MSLLEIMRIAGRALWANKLRSALTALGIVVGVAAVVCMVSVGGGARAEVSEKIRTLGANLLLVMPGAQSSGGARLESGTRPTLTDADAAAIRGELAQVLVAAPLLSRSMPLVAGNKNWVTLVAGVNADYLVAREWQVANGRSFTSDELATGAKVALVGSVIIEELFDGRAGVGETFRIGNVPFTAIGVLNKKGLGASGRSQDDVVFIPLSTAKSRVLGAVRGATREAVDFISIKASDASALSSSCRGRARGPDRDPSKAAFFGKHLYWEATRLDICHFYFARTLQQNVWPLWAHRRDVHREPPSQPMVLTRSPQQLSRAATPVCEPPLVRATAQPSTRDCLLMPRTALET